MRTVLFFESSVPNSTDVVLPVPGADAVVRCSGLTDSESMEMNDVVVIGHEHWTRRSTHAGRSSGLVVRHHLSESSVSHACTLRVIARNVRVGSSPGFASLHH